MLRLLSAVSAKALMIWRSDHAQNRMFLEQNSLRVFSGEANPALGMGGGGGSYGEIQPWDERPGPDSVARAFSSEVNTGSRKENASKQKTRARF
jgi:hypothetical protein